MGVVDRDAGQPGAADGMGEEEFAVADGEVGLPRLDLGGDLAGDPGEGQVALGQMADGAGDRDPLPMMDGARNRGFQAGPAPRHRRRHLPPADEAELVFRQPGDQGERPHDMTVGVSHHPV